MSGPEKRRNAEAYVVLALKLSVERVVRCRGKDKCNRIQPSLLYTASEPTQEGGMSGARAIVGLLVFVALACGGNTAMAQSAEGGGTSSSQETRVEENMAHWNPARMLRQIDGWYRKPGVPEEAVAEVKITPPGAAAAAGPMAKIKSLLGG